MNDRPSMNHTFSIICHATTISLSWWKKPQGKCIVVDNGFVASKAFSLSDNLGRLLENQVFIELIRRGYDVEKTMFYYRSRNDKEIDFVLREGTRILRLVQVCYDMSSPKTEKREVVKCDNLVIVTYNDKRTIEKDGYRVNVVPITEF